MENKLEQIETKFNQRYKIKKIVNAIWNLLIFIAGSSAIYDSAIIKHHDMIDRLRFMTYNGSIFSTIVSLIFFVISIIEFRKETEMTRRFVYYIRLSSVVTEFIIFAVVMVGFLPFLPDTPDVTSYTGVIMHLFLPIMTILSFVFNDAPIGRLKRLEPLWGTTFITIYAVATVIIFGFNILPPEKAPYSFLNFRDYPLWYPLIVLALIYVVAYEISYVFSRLNMRYSWIWFSDLRNRDKKTRR